MVWGTVKDAGGWVRDKASDAASWVGDRFDRTDTEFRDVDPDGRMGDVADQGRRWARSGRQDAAQARRRQDDLASALQRRAEGEDSLAQEQLRQGLGQALAQQQAHAAGARPGQGAAAARQAAQQMGQQATGMAGQATQAGIQERQAAEQQLGGLLGQQRGQDLQLAQAGMGHQLGALGQIEQARTRRHAIEAGQPTMAEHMTGATMGGIETLAAAGLLPSDEEKKEAMRSGDQGARDLVEALKPKEYSYRDEERHGGGRRLGITAQDLEQSDLGRALVRESPEGKQVDVGGLAGALAASVGHLGERIDRLEGGDRGRTERAEAARSRPRTLADALARTEPRQSGRRTLADGLAQSEPRR